MRLRHERDLVAAKASRDIVFKQTTGCSFGYCETIRRIVEDHDNESLPDWGWNDLLNDELYKFSQLHIEKKRIEKELEQFAA